MEKNYQQPTWVWTSSVRGDLNRHMQELIYHLNYRANWLITISSFILVLVISNISRFQNNSLTKTGIVILIFGSTISIVSLMLILVPYLVTSKRYSGSLKNDIFYFRNIGNNFTKKEFVKYVGKLRTDSKELDRIFGESIYNNATIRLPSITAKLKVGGWSLIFSLVLGSFFILAGFLLGA